MGKKLSDADRARALAAKLAYEPSAKAADRLQLEQQIAKRLGIRTEQVRKALSRRPGRGAPNQRRAPPTAFLDRCRQALAGR